MADQSEIVNTSESFIVPAICLAVERGSHVSLRKLIRNGASVNIVDPTTGFTPLHYAVKGRHDECVKVILEQKSVDINKRVNGNAETALHLSVNDGCAPKLLQRCSMMSICQMLLIKGADVTAPVRGGEATVTCEILGKGKSGGGRGLSGSSTALQLACAFMSGDVVKLFLGYPEAGKEFSRETLALHRIAIENGNLDAFTELLDYHKNLVLIENSLTWLDWMSDAYNIAMIAAVNGQLLMLIHIFQFCGGKLKATIGDNGDFMISKALAFPECVRYLVEQQGLKPYYDYANNNTVTFVAVTEAIAIYADFETFEFLLDNIPKLVIDWFNCSSEFACPNNPVRRAVRVGDAHYLEALLRRGFGANRAIVRLRPTGDTGIYHDGEREWDIRNDVMSIVGYNYPKFTSGFSLGSIGLAIYCGNFNLIHLLHKYIALGSPSCGVVTCSLVVFIWKCADNNQRRLFSEMFDRLLNIGARLDTVDGRFTCSGTTIAAACTYNTVVLRRMLTAHNLEPTELLWDMLRKFRYCGTEAVVARVRENVGRSLKSMLYLTTSPSQFHSLCRAMAAGAEKYPSLQRHVLPSGEGETVRQVLCYQSRLDTLRELSRQVILRRLSENIRAEFSPASACVSDLPDVRVEVQVPNYSNNETPEDVASISNELKQETVCEDPLSHKISLLAIPSLLKKYVNFEKELCDMGFSRLVPADAPSTEFPALSDSEDESPALSDSEDEFSEALSDSEHEFSDFSDSYEDEFSEALSGEDDFPVLPDTEDESETDSGETDSFTECNDGDGESAERAMISDDGDDSDEAEN